ncbi:MAG: hypothetical protein R3B70_41855 [Polyangiaceae bacterium]
MRALSVSKWGAAGLVLAALAGLGLAGAALGTRVGDGGGRGDLEGASARDMNQVPTADPASADATNPKEKNG